MNKSTFINLITVLAILFLGNSTLYAQATVPDVTVLEGDAGTSNATAVVTLPSVAPVGGTTVLYTITGNTATVGTDYTVPGDRIIIPQGNTTGNIDIPIIGDTTIENTEDFSIEISTDLANDSGFDNAATFWTSTGTIGFETNAETVYGGSNASNIVLEVDLGSQGFQDVTTLTGVTYDVTFKASRRTSGGPASANVTVAALNGTTTLGSITVTKTVAANPIFSLDEETFTFTAASTTTRISFTTSNPATIGLVFDDLSIIPQTEDDTATITINDNDDLTVDFDAATYTSVNETGNISLTLDVSGAEITATESIEIDITGGTATGGGTDYTFTDPTSVTIPIGDYTTLGTVTVTIPIATDAIVEGDETILLGLINPSTNVSVGTQNTATATINDDDTVIIRFNAATANDTEAAGGNLPTLFVTGTVTNTTTVTVTDATTGTATSGSDYAFTSPQVVNIPAGVYDGTAGTAISIPTLSITDEAIVESAETIDLTLGTATGDATLGTTLAHTYTINDDDSVIVQFNAATANDAEATGGNLPTLFVTGTVTNSTTVLVTNAGTGSATSGSDYTFTSPVPVNIPAGVYDGTAGTAVAIPTLSITDEAIVEGAETIALTLGTATGDATLGTTLAHTYTINNDDTATVTIAADADANEATSSRAFTLTMNAVASTNVDISYVLTGTATNPADYTDVTVVIGTVTIPAGSTTEDIDLTVVDDSVLESIETIIATMTATTNNVSVTASTTPATVNILDNDCQPVTGVSLTLQAGNEASAIDVAWTEPVPAASSYTIKGFETDPGLGGAAAGTADKEITANTGDTSATLTGLGLLSNTQYFVYIISECPGGIQQTVSVGDVTTQEYNYQVTINDTQISEDGSNGPTSTSLTATITNGTNFDDRIANIVVRIGRIDITGAGTIGLVDILGNPNVGIAQNAASGTSNISVFNDLKVEVDETFEYGYLADESDNASTLSINSSTPGTTSIGTITVSSEDATTVQILNPVNGTEGGTNGSFDIEIANQPEFETQITFTPTGTAISGTDYSAITITVPAAAQNADFFDPATGPNPNTVVTETITITITDDALVENLETAIFTITGTNQTLVTLGATTVQNVNINDNDTATVTIAPDANTDETTASRAFTLTMSATSSSDVDVSYALTGTAVNPADYTDVTPVTGTVTIPAGSTTAAIDLTVVNDTEVEITETVIATLTATTNNVSVTADITPATLNITDDDSATLTMSIIQVGGVVEGTNDAEFSVLLDGGATNSTGTPITGTLTLTGTATSGSDYTNITSFSIADGTSSVNILVPVLDDVEVEVTETIIATISAPSLGAVSIVNSATANITDDDSTALTISIIQVGGVVEGTNDAEFSVLLDGAATNNTGAPITGTLTLTGTATSGSDYTNITTFSIADGNNGVNILVPVLNDTEVEVTETIIATISAPSLGAVSIVNSATANITDDDSTALTISIGSPVDGTEGTTDITYTVSLDGGVTNNTGLAITGTVALTGTATSGSDYTDITTFSIADGASSITLTVSITDDVEVEVSETIIATISAPSVGTIGTAVATANITDDDLLIVQFNTATANDAETTGGNLPTLFITGTVTNVTTVTVTDATTGTATSGSDYAFSSPQVVNIPAGVYDGTAATEVVIPTLSITDDSSVEGTETIDLTLGTATGDATLGTILAHTYTINDDDVTIEFDSSNSNDLEASGGNLQKIRINGILPANTDVSITITGTAINGADYTLATPITIPAGTYDGTDATALDLASFITILDDNSTEPGETIVLTLDAGQTAPLVLGDSDGDTTTRNITVYTITGDDEITVQFDSASYTSINESTAITVNLEISGADFSTYTLPSGVEINITGGTATGSGTDYTYVTPTSIAIPNADYTTPVLIPFTIQLDDDLALEGDETISIEVGLIPASIPLPPILSTKTIIGAQNTTNVTITDDDVPQFTVTPTSLNVNENGGTETFTVVLDAQPQTDVVFDISSDAITEATVDLAQLTFTNANWNIPQTVTVTGIDDITVATDTANITVAINDPASDDDYDLVANQIVAITLNNDDVAIGPTPSNAAINVDENGGTTTVNITLGAQPATDVVVNVTSADIGEATVAPVTLTFTNANWDIPQIITITGVDDNLLTGDTLTSVNLVIDDAASDDAFDGLSDSIGVTVIDDDETNLSISITNTIDGIESATPTNAEFEISLDGGLANNTGAPITGTLTLTGSATGASDYTDVTNFTIANGASTVTLIIPVLDDTNVEVTETIIATISSPSTGSISSTDNATANVTDDDATNLTMSIVQIANGAEGTTPTNAAFSVSLDGGVINTTGAPITGIVTLTGTATSGADYNNVASFSIPDGTNLGSIFIQILDDTEIEIVETIVATISSPNVGAVSTANSATTNITDDESLLGFNISITATTDGLEGTPVTDAVFTVSLDGGITNSTGLDITGVVTLTGTATAGTDYTNITSFSIANGSSTGTITISIIDDIDVEVTETIIATISSPSQGTIGTPNATVNLTSDDVENDNDNDGIPDITDPDDDNDGQLDVDEIACGSDPMDTASISIDTDNDGVPNCVDTDDDGDGIPDTEEDTDGDGNPDNDDSDGDGIPDYLDPYDPNGDDDNDGIPNSDEDTDGDGNPNNDDSDGDGIPDYLDTDDDNDGIPNTEEDINGDGNPSNDDSDGDGIPDYLDPYNPNADDDNDGVSNSDEDTDGDGNPYNDDCNNNGTPNFLDTISCSTPAIVAQAFTPNGDGINDTWIIDGIEAFPNSLVKVYNRWGHEVFGARNYQNDWNAIYKSNSNKLPAGSYYYVIDLGDESTPISGWLFINY